MKRLLSAILLSTVVSPALAQNAPAASAHAQYQKYQDLKWEKTNPELGSNSPEIAILHVNPVTQATELLIRSPKNFHVPRHWHSANETITLIRGTFIMEHNDSGNRMELDAGSFAYIPAKMIHQACGGVRLNQSIFGCKGIVLPRAAHPQWVRYSTMRTSCM
jgi:quercetin dioxygenase-like cupin family protein